MTQRTEKSSFSDPSGTRTRTLSRAADFKSPAVNPGASPERENKARRRRTLPRATPLPHPLPHVGKPGLEWLSYEILTRSRVARHGSS
jgi:hypothetical protein